MVRTRKSKVLDIEDFLVFYSRECELVGNLSKVIAENPVVAESDLIYGDSVHPTEKKGLSYQLRTGWSPERLRNHCYVGEVLIARKGLVSKVGNVNALCRMTSHERALRLSEHAEKVSHVGEILYMSPFDRRLPSADLQAVRSHCSRMKIDARCELSDDSQVVRVVRAITGSPRVCIIVPTRGDYAEVFGSQRNLAASAIRSLRENTTYKNIEIIAVIDAEASEISRSEILEAGGSDLTVIDYRAPFNFAEKINLAALSTSAEFLLFMNDDVEIDSPDVIEVMLSYFEDKQVGLVGPMLKFEDGTIQSAGHILNPIPLDLYRGFPMGISGGFNFLKPAREVSGVIAAFAMTRTDLFHQVGGLCMDFPSDYNDVDYALKLRTIGKKTIFTPYVTCWHFESKTRIPKLDSNAIDLLGARWRHEIENDFYGNPMLQRYEIIWKANIESDDSLKDSIAENANWNDSEWQSLQLLEEKHLHRTMFFPHRIWWKN
jgi:glycosyltransferase involved in cell wall biosynthesis